MVLPAKPALWPFYSRQIQIRYAATALLAAFTIAASFAFYSGEIAVLVFFHLHVVILLFAAAILWAALRRRFGAGRRWAVCLCCAPVMALLTLPLIGTARPYMRLANHYSRYMSEIGYQVAPHARYATWDWTDAGGFVPPQVWLVYDESDRTAGPIADAGLQGPEGPETYCPGRSRHLYGHFYICSVDQ